MAEPARQVVDGNAVHQQMPGVTMAERVRPDPLPRRNRAQLLRTLHRRLHPSPGGRGMRLDDSALADISISEGTAERSVQLRMHRYKPGLAALT